MVKGPFSYVFVHMRISFFPFPAEYITLFVYTLVQILELLYQEMLLAVCYLYNTVYFPYIP